MPVPGLGIVTQIAAAIAEGIVIGLAKAWERHETAVEEAANDTDRMRAVRMRDAVRRVLGTSGNSGPIDSTPVSSRLPSDGVGTLARWQPDRVQSEPSSRVVGGGSASGGG